MPDVGASDDRAGYDSSYNNPAGQNTAITGFTLNPMNVAFLAQQGISANQTENTIIKLDDLAIQTILTAENKGISSIASGKEYDFTHIMKNWPNIKTSQNIRSFYADMGDTIQSHIGEPGPLSRQEVEFGIYWDVGPYDAYYKYKNGVMLYEHQEKLSEIQDSFATAGARVLKAAKELEHVYSQPEGTSVLNAANEVLVQGSSKADYSELYRANGLSPGSGGYKQVSAGSYMLGILHGVGNKGVEVLKIPGELADFVLSGRAGIFIQSIPDIVQELQAKGITELGEGLYKITLKDWTDRYKTIQYTMDDYEKGKLTAELAVDVISTLMVARSAVKGITSLPQTLNKYLSNEIGAVGSGIGGVGKTYNINGRVLTETEFANLRKQAIYQAWQQERELVRSTGRGTRAWTEAEKQELLTTGKVKGYEGQHMKSAEAYPNNAGDPNNIQFLKGRGSNLDEHLNAHGGNYKNPTNGYYDPQTGKFIEFGDYVPGP